jgi:hypothetical protein
MDKSILLKYTARVRTETENHYGPIFYLYTVSSSNSDDGADGTELIGPLATNTFLPGMHAMLCKFLGVSEALATKIINTKNREEFKSGKKVLVLIKDKGQIVDVGVLAM